MHCSRIHCITVIITMYCWSYTHGFATGLATSFGNKAVDDYTSIYNKNPLKGNDYSYDYYSDKFPVKYKSVSYNDEEDLMAAERRQEEQSNKFDIRGYRSVRPPTLPMFPHIDLFNKKPLYKSVIQRIPPKKRDTNYVDGVDYEELDDNVYDEDDDDNDFLSSPLQIELGPSATKYSELPTQSFSASPCSQILIGFQPIVKQLPCSMNSYNQQIPDAYNVPFDSALPFKYNSVKSYLQADSSESGSIESDSRENVPLYRVQK